MIIHNSIKKYILVKTVADEVSKLPSISSFVYISASDVFPFIDPRYITTKREAERYLFQNEKFNTVVLRPGMLRKGLTDIIENLSSSIKRRLYV